MTTIVRCNDPRHPDCGLPIARLEDDGTLVILSRHYGQQHMGQVKVQPRAVPVDTRKG